MRVALIGDRFDRSENLALAVLESALAAEGHRVVQVPARGLPHLGATVEEALRHRPALVGISIGYQASAMAALALVHHLRRSGYRGHVSAGGAFATLHPTELLRDCPLDSVVLFEGERPLVLLAAHLERGSPDLAEIPGLFFRGPDGQVRPAAPPRVWEDPFAHRPARPPLQPEHLGVPTASLYASRGCEARCSYCCVAQLTDAARSHAVAAGRPANAVARIRRRPPSDVADEMYALWRRRGVRLFRFEDDCLLGSSPETALRYLAELRANVSARGMDAPAYTFKLRPDCVTPEVAAALADCGMIHGFVGVEALTAETLASIGRRCRPEHGRVALRSLSGASIPVYFNALIVGPDATPWTIERELDALEEVHDAPLDVVTLLLYAGTPLFERLRSEGRVGGNYLCWRYTFADPRTAVVAEALSRLATRRTGAYTIGKRLADLQLNVAIARRFHPRVPTGALGRDLARLVARANRSTISVARRIVAWARTDPAPSDRPPFWRALDDEVGAHDARLAAELSSLFAELESAVNAGSGTRAAAFLRSGLAAAVLGGAQLLSAGCNCGVGTSTDASQPALDAGADAGDAGAGSPDSGPADSGTAGADSALAESGVPLDAGACTSPVATDPAAWLTDNAAEPCVSPTCGEVPVTFETDASGTVVGVSGPISKMEAACILDALSGVCFPTAPNAAVVVTLFGPCD